MRFAVQNGGLAPFESAASTIVTTASQSILELEPFSDECYFHSRTLDATTGRSNSYVRHQQIPDPTAVYKLRIRSMNHQAWKLISNATAKAGGEIRITSNAHGLTGNRLGRNHRLSRRYLVGVRCPSQIDVELNGGLSAQGLDQTEVTVR